MKKLLALLLMVLPISAYSAWNESETVNSSTFTQGSISLGLVRGLRPGDVLRGVILSTEPNQTVVIYDSSATATNQIARLAVSTGNTSQYIPFNVRLSSGITLTATNNSTGFTIIYLKAVPR